MPRERDHDPLGDRQRAAGEARARAARDERHARPRCRAAPTAGDLLGRLRQDHERGHDAAPGEPVALVGAQLLGLLDHASGPEGVLEAADEIRCQRHGMTLEG